MSAGVFAKKPEFVVGKSIKGQTPAPAKPAPAKPAPVKPAAASASSDKQDSEDNAASRAAAGNLQNEHSDQTRHLAAACLHAWCITSVLLARKHP